MVEFVFSPNTKPRKSEREPLPWDEEIMPEYNPKYDEFCNCGHLKREHDLAYPYPCMAVEPDKCSCLNYKRAKRNDQ